ncbi:MAG: hypothetical protein IPN75_10460 [Dechloromonas sp.]|uniref:O-acyltransferase WSD1-like N-terminal domain-containing protein n=1 Tax=Candidatus Dechloromonas phosphorivorans TaxID=2899244 RepID=A0A9D7LNC9_9RHOO|nr:hypothetical protein [Candidatus Dechloromonas phosphorivorans]
MHVASLQIFTPPKGPATTSMQTLYQSWRTHLAASKPFNLRPVKQSGLWCWEEDKEFDLDYHLRHLALPRPGRIRELLVLVSQLHATLLDRNRPLWECYLIEGLADGRFALYLKIHHGLVDGVTGIRMVSAALSTRAKENQAADLGAGACQTGQAGQHGGPAGGEKIPPATFVRRLPDGVGGASGPR